MNKTNNYFGPTSPPSCREQERTLIKGESSLFNFLEDMRLDSNNFFLFHDDIKLLFANKLW